MNQPNDGGPAFARPASSALKPLDDRISNTRRAIARGEAAVGNVQRMAEAIEQAEGRSHSYYTALEKAEGLRAVLAELREWMGHTDPREAAGRPDG